MVGASPVIGTIVPSSSKCYVIARGPETGLYLDIYAGGILGAELNFAGYGITTQEVFLLTLYRKVGK